MESCRVFVSSWTRGEDAGRLGTKYRLQARRAGAPAVPSQNQQVLLNSPKIWTPDISQSPNLAGKRIQESTAVRTGAMLLSYQGK